MSWTLDAQDNFNRADTSDINGSTMSDATHAWSKTAYGGGSVQIVSNVAVYNAGGGVFYWATGINIGDQKSSVVHKTGNGGAGPAVRVNTGGANTAYFVDKSSDTLYKVVAGSYTSLASIPWGGLADGDVISLEIEGTSLTVRKNGTSVATATDSAIATGSYGVLSNNGGTFDDFAGYVPGGGGSIVPVLMCQYRQRRA